MSEIKPLIPKSYIRIALSEFRHNDAAVFFSREEKKFFILVDGEKVLGPLNIAQLEVAHHVITDVLNMRGAYGAV